MLIALLVVAACSLLAVTACTLPDRGAPVPPAASPAATSAPAATPAVPQGAGTASLLPDSLLVGTVSGPAGLVGNTGAMLVGNTGAMLVGNTGATLVGNTGATLVGNTGATLVGNSGAMPVGNPGAMLVGNPGATLAGRAVLGTQGAEPVRVPHALVYLMTPDERFYLDSGGQTVFTTADEQGRYRLPAASGKALVVTAVLPENRRLVGYALLPRAGTATADLSLESTYATEFLRYQARKLGKEMESYPSGRLGPITGLTRDLVASGDLAATPDIGINAIPRLVDDYLLAFAARSRALSDAWKDLLGYRPLAVSTLEGAAEPGFTSAAIEVDRFSGRIFVAGSNPTGVMVREVNGYRPIFRELGERGFIRILGMRQGPDGVVAFVVLDDLFLGGAVDREGLPAIRLFRFHPDSGMLPERRLQLPPALRSYAMDRSRSTAIEPAGLAWHDGKLYVTDLAAGLVYAFTPAETPEWQGEVFAGAVQGTQPTSRSWRV